MSNIIEDYLRKKSNEMNALAKDRADRMNDAPCDACGKDKFIVLYRNVVGEVSGSMTGFFSLFGGSVQGSINGYTKTLPVLSCAECRNEKLVKTWKYVFPEKLFWDEMFDFYRGVKDEDEGILSKINQIYLSNPLETYKFAKDNPNYEYEFYNKIIEWSPLEWRGAGFNFGGKKLTKERGKWIFKTIKEFSWEELFEEGK